jgi:hypothetical protein
MTIRKSTKEKILPYRQQVTRIKQYLSNRDVEVRTGEIEDHMSPDLHYDENKTNVLAAFGKKKKVRKYGSVETLMEQANMRDDERSERAQNMDYSKCATNAYMPKEVADDITKAQRWFKNPNRYDIIGVDAKSSCPPRPKRKKAVKKRRK